MIEQVLYRRTVEQGYNEYRSRGLSKDEAHRVNVVMDMAASEMDDLGAGIESPFLLYPFENLHRFCLAIFQREYFEGRANSVNHGLLLEDREYRELVKSPEKIWGFTNKNFLSRKVNHREEMFALKTLEVSDNPELDKDFIVQEYGLHKEGFLRFLHAIYTSLYGNHKYSFGLRLANSIDANRGMRHLGYLMMSMLPYELRDKLSFCSRSVPDSLGVTVQILQGKDSAKTDIIYDVNTGECILPKTPVEIIDFYLDDLFSMSEAALRDYFEKLADFRARLPLPENSKGEYVVPKLLQLSQNPARFAREAAQAQLAFINDVFSLPTSNQDIISSIVVRLLPFVDAGHYREAFSINFGLYRQLDPEKESDRRIMDQIEDNLNHNYETAAPEEKQGLFRTVFQSKEKHGSVSKILENLLERNSLETDILLVQEYIELYEEFFEREGRSALYWKIVGVFRQSDPSGKEKIWNRVYKSRNPHARAGFFYNLLAGEDEAFYKRVFPALTQLFLQSDNPQLKERAYMRILDVIHGEDDVYRRKLIRDYNDVEEVEDSLWMEAYHAIEDFPGAAADVDFLKCLKEKYEKSSNPKVRDLYLEYIDSLPIGELESLIRQYEKGNGKERNLGEREKHLLHKVLDSLIKKEQKVSVSALKGLITLLPEEDENQLASYINAIYLSTSSDTSIEIYDFLREDHQRLYDNPCLNKESLPSFDYYWAAKLDKRILQDDKKLVCLLHALEKLQYHEKSFAKIHSLYEREIQQGIGAAETEYERYRRCKKLCGNLESLRHMQFGSQYCQELTDQAKKEFWETSQIIAFDYDHCEMYCSGSPVYDRKYAGHENHILAENIRGMIRQSHVDWDKVYELLLSGDYISRESVRNQVIQDFVRKYQEYGRALSDPDYIAFACVNKNNFKMDYVKLFEALQRYHYPIDERSIRGLKIFEYIGISDQLRKKISEYKYYQSDYPSYGDVIRGLFFEQIAVLLLLLANNLFRAFFIRPTSSQRLWNVLWLCNCGGYVLLMLVVALVSIVLMGRANRRRSFRYDARVFGLLIVNMLLSAAAILLSIEFSFLAICLPTATGLMAAAIFLNIRAANTIGRPSKR